MHLLLADDETPARGELRYILEALAPEATFHEATNGEETLRLIENEPVEVAFLDIHMPGLDGLVVAATVMDGPEPPLLPNQSLNARLYDAPQNLIAEAGPLAGTVGGMEATPGSKRLYVPDLAPSWYALAVDGGEGLTEYLLQFHVWPVYLPTVLRSYP